MSKERARRRAEREAAAAAERERRAPSARRRERRGTLARALATTGPRTGRRSGRPSALAARRHRQDGALLAALVAGHVALWLFTDSWAWRLGALVLSVLAWPVLVTVLFDRRPGQG
jgi:Flp pilus assembly protein TadB